MEDDKIVIPGMPDEDDTEADTDMVDEDDEKTDPEGDMSSYSGVNGEI